LKELCEIYGPTVYELYENIVTLLPELMVDELSEIMLNWYLKNAVEPYRSEIMYVSNCSNVPLGDVVAINLLYDMTAWCTSIVAADDDGVIFHGRNLDYAGLPLLRNLTFVGQYINSNGDILYTGAPFFGYVGLWTGFKYDAFSLSGDERDQGSVVANIRAIRDDYWPSGWLMRDVLANENSFDAALKRLNNTQVMAPVYYILGGLKYPDGAVITRDQEHSYNLWMLENSYLDWYEVETNYDWWTPPPVNDDRRDPAINAMNAMGRDNLTAMNLYNDVMSINPVLNDGTLYTTIMSASNKTLFYTRIRFP
jgi:N-acylethanolamine-hydrolysing acid amidase